MKLEQSFDVAAPLERVWEALIDVERVAPCLPGAAVTGRNDDGSYNGEFKVKIGPTSASYSGKLAMENVDEAGHTATMEAKGTDKRGQGGASATIVSTVSDAGNGSTRVEVVTDYHITGKLARFGRGGMIEDISNRLLGDFAKCLQTSLAGDGGAGSAPSDAPAASASASAAAAASARLRLRLRLRRPRPRRALRLTPRPLRRRAPSRRRRRPCAGGRRAAASARPGGCRAAAATTARGRRPAAATTARGRRPAPSAAPGQPADGREPAGGGTVADGVSHVGSGQAQPGPVRRASAGLPARATRAAPP